MLNVMRVTVCVAVIVIMAVFCGIGLATPDGTGLAQPLDSAIASRVPVLRAPYAAGLIGGAAWWASVGLALCGAVAVRSRLRRLEQRWTAALPLVAVIAAEAATLLTSAIVARPRPIEAPGRLILSGRSFPSGPAAMVAALLVSVLMLDGARWRRSASAGRHRTVGKLAVGLLVGIAIVQLTLGLSWFSDVLAGVAVGSAVGMLIGSLARQWPTDRVERPVERRVQRRVTWLIVAAVAILAVPVGVSYSHALHAPGYATADSRTVDWLRSHGMSSVVDRAESWWLWKHLPSTALTRTALPPPAVVAPTSHATAVRDAATATPSGGPGERTAHVPVAQPPATAPGVPAPPALPVAMAPLIAPALPNEGVWTVAQVTTGGVAQIATASIRPDTAHPDLVATLAWMNTSSVRFVLVAGTREPVAAAGAWGATVPADLQATLLAAFNSGYKIKDTPGGALVEGVTSRKALRDGVASLVIHSDGTASVGIWGRDLTMTPDVVAVRQNLHLIIDNGQLVDGLRNNVGQLWGTVKNALPTWRSGIGVDAAGNLLYASGNQMTIDTLALALHQAGAVTAMELDIHNHMVTYNLFTHPPGHGLVGHKLSPDMTEPASRYLRPDQRDFVAVFSR